MFEREKGLISGEVQAMTYKEPSRNEGRKKSATQWYKPREYIAIEANAKASRVSETKEECKDAYAKKANGANKSRKRMNAMSRVASGCAFAGRVAGMSIARGATEQCPSERRRRSQQEKQSGIRGGWGPRLVLSSNGWWRAGYLHPPYKGTCGKSSP